MTTAAGVPSAPPALRLRGRPDAALGTEWTPAESAALDEALVSLPAARYSPLERYARAAAALPRKTMRDVALRVRWLAGRASQAAAAARQARAASGGPPPSNPPRHAAGAGEGVGGGGARGGPAGPASPAAKAVKRGRGGGGGGASAGHAQPSLGSLGHGPPPPLVATGTATTTPAAAAAHHAALLPPPLSRRANASDIPSLLETNYAILAAVKQNMAGLHVGANTALLGRMRDNIAGVLGAMARAGGVMGAMPPLPVSLHTDLAASILPPPAMPGLEEMSGGGVRGASVAAAAAAPGLGSGGAGLSPPVVPAAGTWPALEAEAEAAAAGAAPSGTPPPIADGSQSPPSPGAVGRQSARAAERKAGGK